MSYYDYSGKFLDEYPAIEDYYHAAEDFEGETSSEVNWPKVVFSMLICVIGLVGNSIVIFIILVLREFRKSVTHWYVLQLAVADSLFLLTLPFKSSEDINKMWIYPEWMCKAKESLLFLNYYASVSFLMVMSVDRYVAVCRPFSDRLQKLRKLKLAVFVTMLTWLVCFCLCIPSMILARKVGELPACSCSFVFIVKQEQDRCKDAPPSLIQMCLDMHLQEKQAATECSPASHYPYYNVEGGFNRNKTVSNLVTASQAKPTVQDFSNRERFVTESPNNGFENHSADGQSWEINIDAYNSAFVKIPDQIGQMKNETAQQPEDPIAPDSPFICNYDGAPAEWSWFLGFNFVVMYIFPIVVMSVSYGLIVRKLAKTKMRSDSITSVKQANGRKRKTSAKSRKDRRQVTIMCACLVSAFVLLWLPHHISHLVKIVGIALPNEKSHICEDLLVAGSLLAYFNSALNPYLYSFLGSNFKKRWERSLTSVRRSIKVRRRPTSSGNFTVAYTRKSKVRTGGEGSSSTTGTVMTKSERTKRNRKLSESKSFLDSTKNDNAQGETHKVVTNLQSEAIEVASSKV